MEEDQKEDHGQILAQWHFPEFVRYQRSTSWYVWTSLVVLGLLIYAFFTSNFLFAILIIIASITFYLIYNREPDDVNFKITEDGLEADDRFFPYEDIKSFYIIYNPPETEYLFVDFKSLFTPRLSIPLIDQDPTNLSRVLAKYLKEDLEKEGEPLSHSLSRRFKL